MNNKHRKIATDFIETIWNQNQMDKMDHFLHPEFTDHSLPSNLPPNKEGTALWISGTGKSFEHKTFIEEMVCENNKVMLKINMQMKHIGKWRDIEPQGTEIYAIGYRYLRFEGDKIIEHWALMDGNAIENQLKEAQHGCKIQE